MYNQEKGNLHFGEAPQIHTDGIILIKWYHGVSGVLLPVNMKSNKEFSPCSPSPLFFFPSWSSIQPREKVPVWYKFVLNFCLILWLYQKVVTV